MPVKLGKDDHGQAEKFFRRNLHIRGLLKDCCLEENTPSLSSLGDAETEKALRSLPSVNFVGLWVNFSR
jgi:hypothetical protein